jgi:CRISPR-associated protein Csx17
LLARKWPSVRIAWRDHVLNVVGGPTSLDDLRDELGCVADKRAWTPYQRGWADDQKKSTKAKSGMPLAVWQAGAGEQSLELFAAHAVPQARVSFNPLLGSGGNAGKRDFSDGWKRAVEALAPSQPKKPSKNETAASKAAGEQADKKNANEEEERKRAELEAFLLGKPLTWMFEKLNAASWFSEANKLYNSGQNPFREGLVSPWAMALACEGLAFWVGGASRRLGSRARAQGAFPFVSLAAAPGVAEGAGRDLAEVWAPIWERPMTLPEARALFLRGRAEVGGRGVLTPSAFATAIARRGVDSGITEFLRFTLGRTTSANTFEARFEGRFRVQASAGTPGVSVALPRALECVLALVDRLPADRKVGQRWRFVGLRGPIEAAMLRLAATPDDPEAGCALLDAVVTALDKVDRNKRFRDRRVSWEPLPIQWLPPLFGGDPPGVEARLALALVSAFPVSRPFALYRFGVETMHGHFEHPERRPARSVWHPGEVARVLSRVVMRRTLDWESARHDQEQDDKPSRMVLPATAANVERWLDGAVNDALLARWIARLALFDWRYIPSEVRKLASATGESCGASAPLCLFALFQPLFERPPISLRGQPMTPDLLPRKSGARAPAAARALANLIGRGQLDAALRLAVSRYAMAGVALAHTKAPWQIADPDRFLASVLFPIGDNERTTLIERWLRPRRQQGGKAHV